MIPFVLITGMHRSGTSFIARSFNLCGVSFGDPTSLISDEVQNYDDNRRGHWENRKFLELGEKTLSMNKGGWDDPPKKIDLTDELKNEIKNSVNELTKNAFLAIGYKDPRIPLYFDAWLPQLPKNIIIIGIFRHPLKVAQSLQKRDGFSYEKSISLWEVYNEKLLHLLDKHDGFLLNFDWPKKRIISEIHMICEKLGLAKIELTDWFSEELLKSDKEYDMKYHLSEKTLKLYSELESRTERNSSSELKITHSINEVLQAHQNLLTHLKNQTAYFKSINDKNLTIIKNFKEKTDPLFTLLSIYRTREDLQKLIPEINQGEYARLFGWANSILQSDGLDSDKDLLEKFKDWYSKNDPQKTTNEIEFLRDLIEKQNEQLSSFSIELAKRNESLYDLQFKISNISNEFSRKEAELLSTNKKIVSLTEELSRKEAELLSTNKKIASLTQDLFKKTNDLDISNVQISEYILTNAKKDQQIARLNLELAKTKNDLSIEASKVITLRKEVTEKDYQIRIRTQPDYWIRRFGGHMLDNIFPNNSQRSKYKRIIVTSYNIIRSKGWSAYLQDVSEKLKRKEFSLIEDQDSFHSVDDMYGLSISDLEDFQPYENIKTYEQFIQKLTDHSHRNSNAILTYKPLVSVVMPIYNPNMEYLKEAIESVLNQSYENFELCMCDDGSKNNDEIANLLKRYQDKRIKHCRLPRNKGIVAASNAAYSISKGDYIAFMDQDDLLFPDALYQVAIHINGYKADVLYSDEIKFDSKKHTIEIAKKRDYSFRPFWLANFMSHLTVINRNLVDSEQLFTPGHDFSQDYEMLLRLTEKTDKIVHITRFLYAWRIHEGSTASSSNSAQKPMIYPAARKAIVRTLRNQQIEGHVLDGSHLGQFTVNIDKILLDPSRTINFVLPGIGQGGGARVVFQVANKLKMMGFDANIIFPRRPYFFSEKDADIKNHVTNDEKIQYLTVTNENNFDIRANLIQVPYISDEFIPDALATISTAWPTAYSVKALDDKKGKKFYFVQHYEVWQGPKETVDETYRLDMGNIVVADWLKDKLSEIGGKTLGKVTVPIDRELFFMYPNRMRRDKELRILFQYRPEHEWKGSKDGIEAFKIIKNKCPDVKLVTYGILGSVSDHLKKIKSNSLNGSELRDLYNYCDIMMFPSWTEGCSLPPMESMMCGTTLCTTNCTGTSEYGKHEYNCMISPIKDPKSLAENVIRVIKNKDLRETLSENGHKSVQYRTVERFTEDFLNLMKINQYNLNL